MSVERAILESVDLDHAWPLVEQLSTLVRDAGSEAERRALGLIVERLDAWGVDHVLHEPELLIGLPGRASLVVDGEAIRAKTPSMAVATPADGLTAPLAYEPAGAPAVSLEDLLSSTGGEVDVAGRIVLVEGFPMPARIADLAQRGASGVVAIAPGERIHEMICTPVWGSPDLQSWSRRPALPVVSIARPDGERLIERLRHGALDATLTAEHDTGWRRIPVLVAEIRGQVEPERFVLVHGHIDSWHVGVGDNATGDAALLELARVLGEHRERLARSVRIAWWSGHSQGRYAGSTWYADVHALDLERNCICHVNCDSPGCRDADAFEESFWTSDVASFAAQAVRDLAGQEPTGTPPPRAGDNSFANLGISTFFMLSSSMSAAQRAQRGLYAVGGCGGNVEWHTEDDTLEVADRENLLRDMRLYAGAVLRAVNAPLHPLDLRATVTEIEEILATHATELARFVDVAPTLAHLARLRDALATLHDRADRSTLATARPANDALLAIGRELLRVRYASAGPYRQDPALHMAPLPEVTAALAAVGSVPDGVVRTELLRARNRIDRALLDAIDAARAAVS